MTPMLFRLSCCTAVQLQGSQIANAAKLSSESDTSRLSELYVISAVLCYVPSDVHSCKPAMFQVHCISIFKPLKLTKHDNLPSFMHGPRTVSQCLLGYILIVFLLYFSSHQDPSLILTSKNAAKLQMWRQPKGLCTRHGLSVQ